MPLRRALFLAAALPFALSACSGGAPSKSQAEAALVRHAETALGRMGSVKSVENFGIAGCKEDQVSDGYRCDVSGHIVLNISGMEQRRPLSGAVRFSKASGEWVAHR